jgi:hypothetical protein
MTVLPVGTQNAMVFACWRPVLEPSNCLGSPITVSWARSSMFSDYRTSRDVVEALASFAGPMIPTHRLSPSNGISSFHDDWNQGMLRRVPVSIV